MADENRTINELSAGAGMLGYNNALPFSPEAEQSVLGAILLDSSCLDRVAEILPRPEYFHQVNNSLIYGAMLHWDSRWTSLRFWKSSKNQNRLMKPAEKHI